MPRAPRGRRNCHRGNSNFLDRYVGQVRQVNRSFWWIDTGMNERNADKLRIDKVQSELMLQRVAVKAAITELGVGLELLRQIIDEAPFDGMAYFENDALTCMDHLRETSREMWTQIKEMIDTINGGAANKNVVPTASPQANLVKIQCQLGSSGVWLEATSTHLSIYDFGVAPQHEKTVRLSIPIRAESEKERVIGALLDLAEFLESKLAAAAR